MHKYMLRVCLLLRYLSSVPFINFMLTCYLIVNQTVMLVVNDCYNFCLKLHTSRSSFNIRIYINFIIVKMFY